MIIQESGSSSASLIPDGFEGLYRGDTLRLFFMVPGAKYYRSHLKEYIMYRILKNVCENTMKGESI